MRILAATDFSPRSHRAVRRAGLLAQAAGGEITLVHVVDDDRPRDLVALERREAERILHEQLEAVAELRGLSSRTLVVEGGAAEGVLRAAAASLADLIVMGAPRRQLRNVFVGTTVERVLRAGSYPVLMVSQPAERPYRTTLAAVDLSEPSAEAVRAAIALGFPAGLQLTLVHAFGTPAKGKMAYAGVGPDSIAEYIDAARSQAVAALSTFVETEGLGRHAGPMSVEPGEPSDVIGTAVRDLAPDVLVVGTRGRGGVVRALMGSVAEQVLRSVDIDILAVPPRR